MSIKRKVFETLLIMILTFLIFSYAIMYVLFDKTLVGKIEDYQNTVVTLNQNLIGSFMDSINQTTILLVGDEAIGNYLSTEISDTLSLLQIRSGIQKQFSHYLSLQNNSRNVTYQNTLFLNERLPIASAFSAETLSSSLPGRSSNVYSNEAVKEQEWYQQTLLSTDQTYIFINQETDELCYSKKIQNNYYTGPYDSDGIGVMVIRIPISKLEEILSFTPVTPNSCFVLYQTDYRVLYQSSDIPGGLKEALLNMEEPKKENASFHHILELDEKEYITYGKTFLHGLTLVFLTPSSDIRSQVGSITNVYVSFAIFFILLASVVSYLISRRLTRPIIHFSESIEKIDDTRNFDMEKLNISDYHEIKILHGSFEQLISKTNALIEDIKVQGEKQTASELRALQAQINPHFIYNAMDTVNWIALSKNEDEIANIVSSISNLMRYSITQPDKMVPLSQELINIKEFIKIHQLRYENKIELCVEPLEILDEVFIPKFIVQPLVENSILHGSDDLAKGVFIHILVKHEHLSTTIEISDNGKGCEPDILNRYLNYEPVSLEVTGGFGIRSVNERIRLNFHSNSGLFYFYNESNQLTARIRLDFSTYQNKVHAS